MEGPRLVILVLLLLFVFFTPDQPGKRRLLIDRENIETERRHDFEVLANSSYGDLSNGRRLNLTGFREDDGYFWSLLSTVQGISRKQYESAWQTVKDRAVYRGSNGEIRGDFTRLSVLHSNPELNATRLDPGTEYVSDSYQRNITDETGQLTFYLTDEDGPGHGVVKEIRATLTIESESSPGSGWQVPLIGTHFVETASIVMTTASSRFDSIDALPQFMLSEADFNASKPQVNATIDKLWHQYLTSQPDHSLFAIPSCEIIVWLQPKPIVESSRYLSTIEDELQHPEGAPIGTPPPLAYSAVVFSPDCGYVLEAETVIGPKREAYWVLVRRLLMAFSLIISIQIALLKRQMEKAATPSTRSRISYHSIGIAALGDGLFLMAIIALLMTEGAAFLLIAATGFLCCIHVAFLEVKFIFDIWTVQVGDPARAEEERRRRNQPAPNTPAPPPDTTRTPTPAPAISADGTVGLPLPVTAPRADGAIPIILPPDQDTTGLDIPSTRSSFAAIYSRFYFSLVLLMFVSLWATSWPHFLGAAYANILSFCYLSFWLPQIYRNIMRNCRKALTWEYVLGSSFLRTIPVLYWYVAPRNILSISSNPNTALILVGWVWIQVFILVTQQFLGPRTFVRKSWCPPAYDYHPVLREDDLEAGGGMPIGALASASEAKDKDDKTRKVFDCAICMNEINVPVVSRDGGVSGTTVWLEQKDYMVTPCRHIFHAECLEGWMNLRLVCPVDREPLPPL